MATRLREHLSRMIQRAGTSEGGGGRSAFPVVRGWRLIEVGREPRRDAARPRRGALRGRCRGAGSQPRRLGFALGTGPYSVPPWPSELTVWCRARGCSGEGAWGRVAAHERAHRGGSDTHDSQVTGDLPVGGEEEPVVWPGSGGPAGHVDVEQPVAHTSITRARGRGRGCGPRLRPLAARVGRWRPGLGWSGGGFGQRRGPWRARGRRGSAGPGWAGRGQRCTPARRRPGRWWAAGGPTR
jgi:hypothetical protein